MKKILNKKAISAFTLAEVLITLVIIGVIAAITVPSLISKYKEEQLKTQFKKTYSTITRALNTMVMLRFSGNVECNWDSTTGVIRNSQCSDFYRELSNVLLVQKTCINNAKINGCVPKYQNYRQMGDGCSEYSEEHINSTHTVYVLNDGQILITTYNPLFAVDINGFKGPNKFGVDVFSFYIRRDKTKGYYINDGGCVALGGKRTQQMIEYAFANKE